MPRMRVASFVVQPIVFADDGEDLQAVNVQPVTLSKNQLQEFAADPAVALENVRQKIEADNDG